MAGPTVTVCCKHPPGIIMQVFKHEEIEVPVNGMPGVTRKEFRAYPASEQIKINGPAVPFGKAPGFVIAGGYALTSNVPADIAKAWVDQNKDNPLVLNKIVYVEEKAENATAKAKDHKAVRSGLEPLNPGTIFKNGQELPSDPRWPRKTNPNLSDIGTDRRDSAA
jgi:hypothetical protein